MQWERGERVMTDAEHNTITKGNYGNVEAFKHPERASSQFAVLSPT
jgi:hypothetical protein